MFILDISRTKNQSGDWVSLVRIMRHGTHPIYERNLYGTGSGNQGLYKPLTTSPDHDDVVDLLWDTFGEDFTTEYLHEVPAIESAIAEYILVNGL